MPGPGPGGAGPPQRSPGGRAWRVPGAGDDGVEAVPADQEEAVIATGTVEVGARGGAGFRDVDDRDERHTAVCPPGLRVVEQDL